MDEKKELTEKLARKAYWHSHGADSGTTFPDEPIQNQETLKCFTRFLINSPDLLAFLKKEHGLIEKQAEPRGLGRCGCGREEG